MSDLIQTDTVQLINRLAKETPNNLAEGHATERTLGDIKLRQVRQAENELLLAIGALLAKYADAQEVALNKRPRKPLQAQVSMPSNN